MLATLRYRKLRLLSVAFSALALAACDQRNGHGIISARGQRGRAAGISAEGEEYGEFLARPAELASVPRTTS